MILKFDKMHALGNDFVLIDISQNLDVLALDKKFVIKISDRTFGIGCDLVALYKYENEIVDVFFFNRDGSTAEICVNASRCIGLLMKMHKNISKFILRAETKKYLVQTKQQVSIRMEMPIFKPLSLPINYISELALIDYSHVIVGNPHLVLFFQKIPDIDKIKTVGAQLENLYLFENRINVSFARIISENEIELFVFERGVGLTLACGSGACAAAAAAYKNGLIESRTIVVKQQGGNLKISVDDDSSLTQTGSATYVFSGTIAI